MNYSEAQLEIINTIDGNIGVIASAGSGKTTVLTKRIENMVKNHSIAPQDILAVTFSKKAKENIQDKLKELNVNGVNIETFHSLALKIIGTRYGTGYFKMLEMFKSGVFVVFAWVLVVTLIMMTIAPMLGLI